MPYYRRRYRGRRYGRKRYNRPRYTTLGSARFLAKKAMRGVRYLKGLVNSEKFHIDTALSTTIANTANITHLTAVAQGDNDPGRTGNSIFVRGISYNFVVSINASATVTWFRWVLIMDTQQIGDSTPGFTTVFETETVTSLMNKLTLGRFRILCDKVYTMSVNGRQNIVKRGYFNLKHHVRYNGTASSDVQKGGIYCMFLSNEATNAPTIVSNFRVFFHDN